jgi:ribosomal protein L28
LHFAHRSNVTVTETYANIATKTRLVFEDGYTRRIEDPNIPDKWIVKKNDKEIRFEITSAGRRRAKDSLMF